jgi:Membrane domain of glycerophosphoryl diester phosphodiesterase
MSDPDGWTAPGGHEQPAQHPAQHPAQQPAPPAGGWGAPPGWTGPAALAPLRPGIVPLRPLSLGELYDGAFQAVRTNPAAVLGSSAVVVVVLTAIGTLVQALYLGRFDDLTARLEQGGRVSADEVAGPLASVLAGSSASTLVTLVATSILAGVITVAVSTAVLGRRTAAGALWRRVRGRAAALVGLALLVVLISGAAVLVCLAPGGVLLGTALASGGSGVLAGGVALLLLGALAAVAAYLFLDTRLFLATPALVLEHQPVRGALRRAWALSRHGFWRLLGIRLLTVVIVGLAGSVVVTPFGLLGGVVAGALGHGDSPLGALLGGAVGQALVQTVLFPLSAAVTALQYIDQRMRREGLDVELARAAAEPG